jgi:hypothetical protein
MQKHMIQVGDIVCFKKIYNISIIDLINRENNYSKYMMVLSTLSHLNEKSACKVLCANGEINWVSMERLEKV